jgi:uncharacterized membrane protein
MTKHRTPPGSISRRPSPSIIDRVFVISLWLKGIDGLLELVGGVFLLLLTPAFIQKVTHMLVAVKLGEDPTDIIANAILRLGQQLGAAHLLVAIFLLTHGIVKVLLVTFLLLGNLKVYPWAMAILGVFALYQAYLTWHHFSLLYLGLTLFDVLIVVLIWYEYRHMKQRSELIDLPRDPPNPYV